MCNTWGEMHVKVQSCNVISIGNWKINWVRTCPSMSLRGAAAMLIFLICYTRYVLKFKIQPTTQQMSRTQVWFGTESCQRESRFNASFFRNSTLKVWNLSSNCFWHVAATFGMPLLFGLQLMLNFAHNRVI